MQRGCEGLITKQSYRGNRKAAQMKRQSEEMKTEEAIFP